MPKAGFDLLKLEYNKLKKMQKDDVCNFQKGTALFKEIEKYMTTDGCINLVICNAGRGPYGVALEEYLNNILPFVEVRTWAFEVTFFFKGPMITLGLPGKLSYGAKDPK